MLLARRLRQETTMSLKWIAQCLHGKERQGLKLSGVAGLAGWKGGGSGFSIES